MSACSDWAKPVPSLFAAVASWKTSTSWGLMCAPIGSPSTWGNCQLPSVVSALNPGLVSRVPRTWN